MKTRRPVLRLSILAEEEVEVGWNGRNRDVDVGVGVGVEVKRWMVGDDAARLLKQSPCSGQ